MIACVGQASAQSPSSSDTLVVQINEVLVRGTRPAATSGVAGTVGVPHDLGWGVFTIRGGAGYFETPGQTLPSGITGS